MAKRILYIYGGLYSPNGMSAIISQKINYLADNTNNEMYVVLTEHPELPWYYQLSNKVHVKYIEVNFDDLDTMPIFKKILYYWFKQRRYKRMLTQYIMELQPDITVSITRREINFINDIPDGSRKIAEIHFTRSFYRQFKKKYFPTFINQWISKIWMNSLIANLKLLDRFVVLTEEDSHNWPELDNVIIIPNFISFMPERKSEVKNKRVISAGRYDYVKGFDLLIDAWAIVTQHHPEWRLDIYGPGNNKAYQELANRKGVSESLHCNTSANNLFDLYADSSIYVLSSRSEGFGLVLFEALGTGLPVVSFACPCGPRDIIENGVNGLLAENGNVQDLADKICYMIEHDEERKKMSRNAVSSVSRFQKDVVMQKWIQLFDSL